VRVTGESSRGGGTVVVPLNSAATRKAGDVFLSYVASLVAAGLILFLARCAWPAPLLVIARWIWCHAGKS